MRHPDENELDALMARLSSGERAAFDPLFSALSPRALRFARARLGEGRAEDAAQAALLKVFERASEFEPGRPVLPWFYAVVANEVRAIARRDKGRDGEDASDVLTWQTAEGDPEAALVERELRAALARAIDALDTPSAEAIAAVLGQGTRPTIDAPAFRKRVSRAYARLRILLGGGLES